MNGNVFKRRSVWVIAGALSVISISAGILIIVMIELLSGVGTPEAMALVDVMKFKHAIQQYVADGNEYPGMHERGMDNMFPILYSALIGGSERGGRGPYVSIDKDRLVVYENGRGYKQATIEDINDNLIPKYILDPWDKPYIYRLVKREKAGPVIELYSCGPNGKDDSWSGTGKGDDVHAR
jgi:hypothetical protein